MALGPVLSQQQQYGTTVLQAQARLAMRVCRQIIHCVLLQCVTAIMLMPSVVLCWF